MNDCPDCEKMRDRILGMHTLLPSHQPDTTVMELVLVDSMTNDISGVIVPLINLRTQGERNLFTGLWSKLMKVGSGRKALKYSERSYHLEVSFYFTSDREQLA